MSHPIKRAGLGTFFHAAGAALQWRLMLLWLAGLLVPTFVFALPVKMTLGAQLDQSLQAAGLATGFDTGAFSDVFMALQPVMPTLQGAGVAAMLLALLISPLLTGMAITAIRSGRKPGFGELLSGGLAEYGRLFRMLIVAGIVLGLALAAGSALIAAVAMGADKAIVESELEWPGRWAMIGAVVLFVLAHATIESGRAQFAADDRLRSALRAWGRGVMQLFRRPLATLGLYLLVTVVGLLLVALFARWRIAMPAASGLGFLAAFLVAQLVSLATAWMRTARLYALASIVRR